MISRNSKKESPPDLSLIKDPDLRAELEEKRGTFAFDTFARRLIERQQERDATNARRSDMTPIQRRHDELKEFIEVNELQEADRYHLHSVLALCGLPYRKPKDELADFSREYGRNSLIVQPGYLKDPVTGKMVRQGIPYGTKARLLQLQLCTQALRQDSPIVEMNDSMSAFIREMGFPVTGGKNGTINLFKDQLHRMAGSRMIIGLWNGEETRTINTNPIDTFDIWLPKNPDQKTLWASTLHLDQKFFNSLKEHALPVDMRIIRGFAHSAKQMDMINWLGYRLKAVIKPYLITWNVLKEQFGQDVARPRRFVEDFTKDLEAIFVRFSQAPREAH